MEHNEYWLLVDGAHEAEIITGQNGKVLMNGDAGSSPNSLDEWIEALEEDAASHGGHWQVFVTHHGDHKLLEPCECEQYEQSHKPIWERSPAIATSNLGK